MLESKQDKISKILRGAFIAALSMPDFYKDPEKFKELCDGVAKTIINEVK